MMVIRGKFAGVSWNSLRMAGGYWINSAENAGLFARIKYRDWLNIVAKHGVYSRLGDFYHKLEKWPGAVYDFDGYVIFNTKEDYTASKFLRISPTSNSVHVIGSLKEAPGYIYYPKHLYNYFEQIPDEKIKQEDISKIKKDKTITATERSQLIQSRIGQGLFRQGLLEKHKKCQISGISCVDLLIASHIKSWGNSNNAERLDINNGLLLNALIDRAFDRYLITFSDSGEVIVSESMTIDDVKMLGINGNKITIEAATRPYLSEHRKLFSRMND